MPSMRRPLSIATAAITCSVNAAFGPAFSTGPAGGDSWTRETTSTLVLPDPTYRFHGRRIALGWHGYL